MAVVDSVIVGIDSAKLRDACEEDHDFGYLVMRRLVHIAASRAGLPIAGIDMFASPEAQMTNEHTIEIGAPSPSRNRHSI
jgi:hypothetical protein